VGWQECPTGHRWRSKFQPSPRELFCKDCGECAFPSLLAKSTGPGLKAIPETQAEREIHGRFSDLVTEWGCFFADRIDGRKRRPNHLCWGDIDPHHIVPVDYMEKQLGLPFDVMYDPLLGVPLCRVGHTEVEDRNDFIYWDELDPEAVDFCRKHGLLPRLELESPRRGKAAA
jgi:hypothetical protein